MSGYEIVALSLPFFAVVGFAIGVNIGNRLLRKEIDVWRRRSERASTIADGWAEATGRALKCLNYTLADRRDLALVETEQFMAFLERFKQATATEPAP